ncbi:ribosomal L1 domain-containing protein 1-like [Babylonia areolata]|uniref:ribosomal L1 domain-containing protein 1-like n=1 Tax=Babylonia areolata TaxID=304850 RepID=UPI003FD0F3AD
MEGGQLATHAQVQKTVEALLKLIQEKSKDSNRLLNDANAVHLQFALKKIDSAQRIIKLKLPNGLDMNKEVCLFVKDLDKSDRDYEKSVRHFKHRLKTQGIGCVAQVIPLKALKLEYKPYEAKRKLSNSFDVFLADARIIRLLPAYLGKAFYGRKRQPIQVRMDSKDLKGEFEAAITNSRCVLSGKGSVGTATVGNTDMSVAELVQNISACAEQIAAAIPGGAINIRNMYIKTTDSMAVPFYMSTGSANEVQLPESQKKKLPAVTGEVTTVDGGLVKVFPSGVVKVVDEAGKAVKRAPKAGKKLLNAAKRPVKAVKRAGKRDPKGKKRPKQDTQKTAKTKKKTK